jgi:hypothetical protein
MGFKYIRSNRCATPFPIQCNWWLDETAQEHNQGKDRKRAWWIDRYRAKRGVVKGDQVCVVRKNESLSRAGMRDVRSNSLLERTVGL